MQLDTQKMIIAALTAAPMTLKQRLVFIVLKAMSVQPTVKNVSIFMSVGFAGQATF
jgi:hypothetical protein